MKVLVACEESQRVCPPLMPTYQIPPPEPKFIDGKGKARYFTDSTYNKKARSVTFEGIAAVIAWQFTHNFYVGGCI